MKCPKCDGTLSYAFTWTVMNPYRFTCPYCKTTIKVANANAILGLFGLMGLSTAGVAIGMEWLGRWQTEDSMLLFLIVGPVVIIGGHYLLFRCKAWKLSV